MFPFDVDEIIILWRWGLIGICAMRGHTPKSVVDLTFSLPEYRLYYNREWGFPLEPGDDHEPGDEEFFQSWN